MSSLNNIPEKPASIIQPTKQVKHLVDRFKVQADTEELWSQTGIDEYKAYCSGLELGKSYVSAEGKYSFVTGAINAIFDQIKTQIGKEQDLSERQRKQAIATHLHTGMLTQINILKELNIIIDESILPPILHGYVTAQLLHTNYDHKNEHQRAGSAG
jgi:ribosome-associated translation inhibitor RaiA